ncbi:DUF5686 and carboxypeptidase regulatory-like domain-containing protein [Marinigracilibium pacificum]|uniref:Carboxypeptidase-like regulatory domain-containing protein n=1 Tax=Marinigracilibium pacificum TaxID=2729599 RepID=A0A848J4R8_9BACT|nr:DUF5686 and carboxypeptidase regulatory-like domain-containing protein [Marinigracilibium pacificum]NMM49454.1 carboxypeptidase-like regulatory domain-containing protein [Marinigracilibium pacificum]
MFKFLAGVIIFLLPAFQCYSQTLKGTVKDEQNTPLGFTAVYISEINEGTSANENGEFQFDLSPGNYTVMFQYMGYKSKTVSVSIVADEIKQIDIVLEPQVYSLPELQVTGSFEDPAYAIIRKASAKAMYHLHQVDEFTAKVYLKGKGRFEKIPGIVKRRLEKEGLNQDQLYIGESLVKVKYKRPSTYEQEVLAVRSKGESQDFSPGNYIFGSFYESTVAGVVSPLSKKCFAYYKYEYLGSFKEGDYEVNKIRVIPRVKDSELFNGNIYIIEDLWALHSVDLFNYQQGIKINIQQNLAPVRENVWLPISHKFFIKGSFVGFEFSYDYLAGVSDYEIDLNEDLVTTLEVVDEKTEAVKVKNATSDQSLTQEDSAVFTVSNLMEDVEMYVEEERKGTGNEKILERYVYKNDSSLKTADKSYWDEVRTIPLTQDEIVGYTKLDSTIAKMDSVAAIDSTKSRKLSPFFLLVGDHVSFGRGKPRLDIDGVLENTFYNTVNGVNVALPVSYSFYNKSKNRWKLNAVPRYNFSSENFQLKGGAEWQNNVRDSLTQVKLEGGYFVDQINNSEPITPLINSISTLFWRGNYMKLYDKHFVTLKYFKDFVYATRLQLELNWEKRQQLFNNTDYTFNGRVHKEYSSNIPENRYLNNTAFPDHQVFNLKGSLHYIPGLKYNMYNDRLVPLTEYKPELILKWDGTIPIKAINDLDYLKASIGIRHKFKAGANLSVLYDVELGGFFYKDSLSFVDYNHFRGNQTPFLPFAESGSFNFLDYYQWSTDRPYMTGMFKFSFRKLLITQVPQLRLIGMKEYFFFNNLTLADGSNYFEGGYGVTNLFRFLRLEVGGGYDTFKNKYWGVRIGVSPDLL